MSTQKNEQYHILSPEWLRTNPLPDDAEVQVHRLPFDWVGSARQGKLADPRDLPKADYRTQRADLPPEAYITPPTDTTGSGREGETGCGPKSGHCAECGTTEGALVLLEDTTLCEECNMADHVVKLRLIDELTAQVEALRRDGERLDWLEKNAVKELKIDNDGTYVQLDRWHRKYITAHSWTEPTLRAAIDSAQRQEGR